MRSSYKNHIRQYLVARGASCIACKAHGWRAFKDPEEKDMMSPCTLSPIYTIRASAKHEAVTLAKSHFASSRQPMTNPLPPIYVSSWLAFAETRGRVSNGEEKESNWIRKKVLDTFKQKENRQR